MLLQLWHLYPFKQVVRYNYQNVLSIFSESILFTLNIKTTGKKMSILRRNSSKEQIFHLNVFLMVTVLTKLVIFLHWGKYLAKFRRLSKTCLAKETICYKVNFEHKINRCCIIPWHKHFLSIFQCLFYQSCIFSCDLIMINIISASNKLFKRKKVVCGFNY